MKLIVNDRDKIPRRTKIIVTKCAKRDDLNTLPTKELVDGLMTWTKRQGDRWTPQSKQVQGRRLDKSHVAQTWHEWFLRILV